jgi:hypothetical protein
MNTLRLTVTPNEFDAIRSTIKKIILRGYEVGDYVRRNRNRPQPDYEIRFVTGINPQSMTIGYKVKDVRTVAIYYGELQPLWIDGEPVDYETRTSFAQQAGYKSWSAFAVATLLRYSYEFDGYSIEW